MRAGRCLNSLPVYPQLSIFDPAFNVSKLAETPVTALPAVYSIINRVVSAIPAGQMQLVADGSTSDPASLGIGTVMAGSMRNDDAARYKTAVTNQLDALLQQSPRTNEGAISHRTSQVQLWSDFMSMAPPFFAMEGLVGGNQTLLQIAYDQLRLYRDALLDQDTKLFKHVVYGNDFQDEKLWTTGNGELKTEAVRLSSDSRLP